MATRLKIIWDGDVKGLSEHRISVSAFGFAITRLNQVLRRIASSLVKNAISSTERTLQGRYADEAKNIEIEIAAIEAGSGGISALVTFTPSPMYQFSVFGNLDELATLEFIESVEKESQGIMRDASVRKYLHALPPGLISQKYIAEDESGAQLRAPLEISTLHLAELPKTTACLTKHHGNIVAIGFEPGKTEVRLKRTDGKTVILAATKEQVLAAWELRDSNVKALAVSAGRYRLVSLKSADEADFEVTAEQVNAQIFQKWDELLRRLAQ